MIPIPGASRIESAQSSAAAADLALPAAAIAKLTARGRS
jgi:aryl-alcohol dehydrogenase-like predicted oxidoreductase